MTTENLHNNKKRSVSAKKTSQTRTQLTAKKLNKVTAIGTYKKTKASAPYARDTIS